jgi:2'-5' RNA ligase
MRLFVAIPMAAAVLDELSAVSARLRSSADGLRWTEPASWHITLQFLGNASGEQYQCLVARLGAVRFPPVPIRMEGLGCFDRAGIFYAGVGLTPALATLQQRITAATSLCGFVPEARPYRPHITLARGKGHGRGQELRALEAKVRRQPSFTPFIAGEFLLYESHLSPAGSRYEVRNRFSLSES